MKIKNIVTIGGGSGQYTLLSGLRDIAGIDITAVVSMVDSGGSTGRLRDELGILPPGDVLKCILALSPNREQARKILQKRFNSKNRLHGHNAGNMLLSMLAQYAGNFPAGVDALGQILDIKGKVLPVTIDKATLVAELTSGQYLYGETTIDVPRGNQREKIKKTFLVPHHSDAIRVYPPVIDAIKKADYIIIGPGDLYTSIVPNFLVPGVAKEIKKTKAKLIYIVNIMTKFGETDDFSAEDFIKEIETKLLRKLDYILVNSGKVEKKLIGKYNKQKAKPIAVKKQDKRYVLANFVSDKAGLVRHDSKKIAKVIEQITKIL